MIINHLKVAARNIGKNKVFSLINIAGLAVGMGVFILIMLWVGNEKSYNRFHAESERIAMIMVNKATSADNISSFPACPPPLARALKNEIPEIAYASRCSWGDVRLIAQGGKSFSPTGFYVDPDFLNIFTFPLVNGNSSQVLREPNTILITETIARKYFGDEDPIGKVMTVEQSLQYKVQGVIRDLPANSTIKFDFLMPMQDYIRQAMQSNDSWTTNNVRTYVKLNAGVDHSRVNASLKDFMQHYTDQQKNTSLFLFGLPDWYLRNDFKNGVYAGGGRITYVNLFVIIATFILLLACINFMNLSTARATYRAREVGVRKAIGADRKSLVAQFITESVFLSLMGGIIAMVLAILALPALNAFLRKEISIDFSNYLYLIYFVALIVVTGLIAGSYPALVLSAFKPVKVLKTGTTKTSGSVAWIRKALVVAQFVVSVMLITGTIVVYKQINYVKNKNLGYDRDNLIWFPNSIDPLKTDLAINEFKKVPGVIEVSRASTTFTSSNNRGEGVSWPGKQPGEEIFFSFIAGDHSIIQAMEISMKEGRAFSTSFATDTTAFILNEEAVRRMGLKDPVGQIIETYGGRGEVVGVAKDFHIESLHSPVTPVIIECRPDWTWLFFVRIDGRNIRETLSGLDRVYKTMAPGYSFDYTFQDNEYERLYRSEQQIGTLVNWFAFFAIFISCLGLLGLTTFTIERRTREIGIRKVLGANTGSLVRLLSKDFIVLVMIAQLVAFPVVWWTLNKWLQDFAYHITIEWWVFVVAAGAALTIALLTVSFQAIRAATTNPVKSLRVE